MHGCQKGLVNINLCDHYQNNRIKYIYYEIYKQCKLLLFIGISEGSGFTTFWRPKSMYAQFP